MIEKILSLALNIILIVLLYITYSEKNEISEKLTELLIQKRDIEIELHIDENDRLDSIKRINKKYKVGLRNSIKIFETLKIKK